MGGLFSAPKAPVVPPPAPMPTPDDEASLAAKRKAQKAAASRSGRQSTILTDFGSATGGNKLGG